MKFGLELSEFGWAGGPHQVGDTLAEIGRTADQAGFSVIGVADHLWQGAHTGGPDAPMLECLTTLAALAAHTREIALMTGVVGVHFRHPASLAKAVTSLDVISGGRAVLGIGVGWDSDECAGNGIPFPSTAERFGMIEDTLRVCLAMWQGDSGSGQAVEGTAVTRALNLPQVLSRPRPPILIGGGGSKTLGLVAKYADACNLYPTPDLAERLDELRGHCEAVGRDYAEIEKTVIFPLSAESDCGALLSMAAMLGKLGIDTMIGMLEGPTPVRTIDTLAARLLPALATLELPRAS